MFIRALFAFLVLPVVAAGVIPWILLASEDGRGAGWGPGAAVMLIGLVVLLWCVRDFYVRGKGTLAPWDPPKQLVVVGLYRLSRNPMYIGVLLLVLGWSLRFASPSIAVYALVLAVGFHLRVVIYEEPTLDRLFGEDWRRYRAAVPRWLPRLQR
jgi:protein-S-isoprenylcysteine O-methyltransferase Ste14